MEINGGDGANEMMIAIINRDRIGCHQAVEKSRSAQSEREQEKSNMLYPPPLPPSISRSGNKQNKTKKIDMIIARIG